MIQNFTQDQKVGGREMKFFNGTKEPTEMDRVMENITQTENEIRGRIYQLGEMFYQANKEKDRGEVEEQYYAVIDLVNKLEQNRIGYYKNKLRLEGQMMCAHCGAVIPYGSMFCNVCGQRADGQTAAPAMGVAPAPATPPMGAPTPAAPPMGTPIPAAPPMGTPTPAVPPVGGDMASAIPPAGEDMAAGAEAASTIHKCSQCGAVLEEGSLFCESCGAKVQ